jgi:hypothetical protein
LERLYETVGIYKGVEGPKRGRFGFRMGALTLRFVSINGQRQADAGENVFCSALLSAFVAALCFPPLNAFVAALCFPPPPAQETALVHQNVEGHPWWGL